MSQFDLRVKDLLTIRIKNFLPFTIDHFDEEVHHTTAFRKFNARINNLGTLTTEYLNLCADEDYLYEKQVDETGDNDLLRTTFMSSVEHQKQLRSLYEKWAEELIATGEEMTEIRENVTTYEEDNEVKTRKIRGTHGLHVFTEVTRLFYLINRPRLIFQEEDERERQTLANTRHPLWIEIYRSFDITTQYQAKEDKDKIVEDTREQIKKLWNCPVYRYRQTEVILIVLFLTQQLNDVKQECIEEYRSVFHAVWLRISVLIQEYHDDTVLNDPLMRVQDPDQPQGTFVANRNFNVFNSIYVSEVMRRFFYYDLLSKRPMQLPAAWNAKQFVPSIKLWIERIVNGLPDEAFVDMHFDMCSTSYKFVGDMTWFKFQSAQAVYSINSALLKLRPHLYRKYFSEEQITKKSVLESINTCHASRLTIFSVISSYIQIKMGTDEVQWYKGVVIHSDEIRMSHYNLSANRAPLILQVFSSYWAYDQKEVYMTDDFFETIAVWFLLLKNRYNSLLLGHDCSPIAEEALRNLDYNQLPIDNQQNRGRTKRDFRL